MHVRNTDARLADMRGRSEGFECTKEADMGGLRRLPGVGAEMRVIDNPACSGCPMQAHQPSATFVPPKSGTSERCAVGEAPGEEESRLAEPFVGASGKMLDGWFHKVGVSRSSLWMTNVLACRPPDNLFPTDPKARKYMSIEDGRRTVQH